MRRYVEMARGSEPEQSRFRDWRQIAEQGIFYAWRALLVTVLLAIVAGIIYPASRTTIPEDPLLQSFDCAAPPCFPQTPASRLGDVLVELPPFGYALAVLFCLPGLLVGGRDLLEGQMDAARRLITPFLGTLLVLICIDAVPRFLNPCTALGPSLGGLCGEFAGRWDVQLRWHTLHHALLGALPFTLLFGLFSGRIGKKRADSKDLV